MNNVNTIRQFDQQIREIRSELHHLTRAGSDNGEKILRLENGTFKLGPKSPHKTRFWRGVRAVLSQESKLGKYAQNRVRQIQNEENTQCAEAIARLTQVKAAPKSLIRKSISDRRVTLHSAQDLLTDLNNKVIPREQRVLPPWLDPHKPFRDSHGANAKTPGPEQMKANFERDYRVVLNASDIKEKLTQEKEAAAIQQQNEAAVKFKTVKTSVAPMPLPEAPQATDEQYTNTVAGHKQLQPYKESIKAPAGFECDLSYETSEATDTGVAHSIGQRPEMEDAHLTTTVTIKTLSGEHKIQVIGVFDGHGGAKKDKKDSKGGYEAALHMSQHMAGRLQDRLQKFNAEELTNEGVWNALKIAFVDTSNSFHPSEDKPRVGSTANVTLIMDNGDIWNANSGDSRAMLLDPEGHVVQMSEDAKPGSQKYHEQIEARGSEVTEDQNVWTKQIQYKAGGVTSTARALGEHYLYGAVSARPKVTKFAKPENGWKDYTLIQTCDGVVDVSTSQQIGENVAANLKKGDSPSVAAAKLVETAYNAYSRDNLTALVTPLK